MEHAFLPCAKNPEIGWALTRSHAELLLQMLLAHKQILSQQHALITSVTDGALTHNFDAAGQGNDGATVNLAPRAGSSARVGTLRT